MTLADAVKTGRKYRRKEHAKDTAFHVYGEGSFTAGVSLKNAIADDWEVEPEKLKLCPFCGNEANSSGTTKYPENHEARFADSTRVLFSYNCGCATCGASTKGLLGQQTKELAIEKWNRRTP